MENHSIQPPRHTAAGFFLHLLQGVLIGLGAVLPGLSGGVLCVVFGVYAPMMALLSHPLRAFRQYAPVLLPIALGMGGGFLGVSRLLGLLLNAYPDASVCVFAGLIAGMFPALFREAGKAKAKEYAAMGTAFTVVLALLAALDIAAVSISPHTGWYGFCGFCLALSIIAPGLSFSTLLMPLGLYTPFVEGIGALDGRILCPAGIAAVLTVLLLARVMHVLLERYHALVSYTIIGIVAAATLAILPYQSVLGGFVPCAVNSLCLAAGAAAAQLLDRLSRRVDAPETVRQKDSGR